NVTYTFVVEAQNGAGFGPFSVASAPVFIGATIGAPSPPNSVAAAFDGSVLPGEAANVTWAAPNQSGNSPITNYEVIATPGTGGSPITNYVVSFNATNVSAGAVTTLTVGTGTLARCTTYSVHVVATNQWGSSGNSGTITRANAVSPNTVGGQFLSSPGPASLN